MIHLAPVSFQVAPTLGVTISSSQKIRPGRYALVSAGTNRPAITIKGQGLVLDFRGVTLAGAPDDARPDQRDGIGVLVEGSNITIRNLRAKGYRIALHASGVRNLTLENCDFSDNRKNYLYSTPEKEDLRDWMSYHHNEKGEWLTHGGGLYLDRVNGAKLRNVTVLRGQNGLMMNRTTGADIAGCNFSFNSGLGIGMYRSSKNRIFQNKLDYNLRGFGYGAYNRGQDSAGLLMFEDCDDNVVAYNSVTHSGDGFFLWAGQSTMDTGRGGADRNLLYGNDWSHAPTNGIEATFSTNTFAGNLVMECWHGVWGGYSYKNPIVGNLFAYNTDAIAIEHGRDNPIEDNLFFRNATDLRIWSNPTQDPNWGYPKFHETTSRDYTVRRNVFAHTSALTTSAANGGHAFRLNRTTGFNVGENRFLPVGNVARMDGPLSARFAAYSLNGVVVAGDGYDLKEGENRVIGGSPVEQVLPPAYPEMGRKDTVTDAEYFARFRTNWDPRPEALGKPVSVGALKEGRNVWRTPTRLRALAPKPVPGIPMPFLPRNTERGWRTMFVGEWGPYDFNRPLLVRSSTGDENAYRILGPKGRFRVVSEKGYRVEGTANVPGDVRIVPIPNYIGQAEVVMEYVGGRTIDEAGNVTPAGRPVRFGFSKWVMPLDWTVNFYLWKGQVDPNEPTSIPVENDFQTSLTTTPIATEKKTNLEYGGYGRFMRGVPSSNFATVAQTPLPVPPGDYELTLTTDDGARVFLDGTMIFESWKHQGPTEYKVPIKVTRSGQVLKIVHFQIAGYAALKAELRPVKP